MIKAWTGTSETVAGLFITRLVAKRVLYLIVVLSLGITAAVMSILMAERRHRHDWLQQDALQVLPTQRPIAVTTADARSRTQMLVSVNNAGVRTISDVRINVRLRHGAGVYECRWDEIPPLTSRSAIREPTEAEWAPKPGAAPFDVVVVVTFVDANGRTWLRDSDGQTRQLR